MPVVQTDGRSLARSVYGHVITKFSEMGRLPHFLSYGALPTRALRARVELRYKYSVAALSAMTGLPTREHLLLQDCTSVSDASILMLLKIFVLICKFLVVFEGRGKGLFNIIIITADNPSHTSLYQVAMFCP